MYLYHANQLGTHVLKDQWISVKRKHLLKCQVILGLFRPLFPAACMSPSRVLK